MAMSDAEIRQRISTYFPGNQGEQLVACIIDARNDAAAVKSAFNTLVTKMNVDNTAQNALAAFPLTLDTNYAGVP